MKLLIALFTLLASTSSWSSISDNIGSWQGTLHGENIEIALWFMRKGKTAEDNGFIQGYSYFKDSNCLHQLEGTEEMLGTIEITARGRSGDMTNGKPCRGSKILANMPHKRFEVALTLSSDRHSMELRAAGLSAKIRLKKHAASKEMLMLIDQHGRFRTSQKASEIERKIIMDGSLIYSQYDKKIDMLNCNDHKAIMNAALKNRNIKSIKAFVGGQGIIKVIHWDNKDMPGFYSLPSDSSVDWHYVDTILGSSKSNCPRAKSVKMYLDKYTSEKLKPYSISKKKFNAGIFERKKITGELNGYYLVDSSGVDKVLKARYISKGIYGVLASTRRVYGKTNTFFPGDITSSSRWNDDHQLLTINHGEKHSYTGTVNITDETSDVVFTYDERNSKRFNTNVWHSNPLYSMAKKTCVRKVIIKGEIQCGAWSDNKIPTYYLSNDFNVAKKIFNELSPKALKISDLSCSNNGPLCNIPGGKFYNAIYRGDIIAAKYLLDEYIAAHGNSGKHDGLKGQKDLLRLIMGKEGTLLEEILVLYMKDYTASATQCFRAGAIAKTFRAHVNGYKLVDGYGRVLYTIPAKDFVTTYKVNPEFIPVCNKLCNKRGQIVENLKLQAFYGSNKFDTNKVINFISSIMKIKNRFGCNTKELKQFENNLIKLYTSKRSRKVFYERNSPRAFR